MSAWSDFVALSLLPLGWRRHIGEHLRAGQMPGIILQQLLAHRAARTLQVGPDFEARVNRAIARAAEAGIDLIPWTDDQYPPTLAAISDPPPLLWMRGRSTALRLPAVAIVGSRAGSSYALAVAERLAGDLAARGVAVISGLARGVDSAAHRGALATGVTIAVLGSGADVVYPPEHGPLARQIAEAGAVLSELAPGTAPRRQFFPLRNRIISGLARAVVVVEAGEKSGSLITARCALDQGRDVLAVPGNVLSGRNRGGHALLRDGARIVETADDVLQELGLDRSAPDPSSPGLASNEKATAREDPILACLTAGEPCDLDALAERTGLSVPRLLPRLLELELQGRVARAGGGRFVRI